MENVKKFYDALANDKAMQERANALNKEGERPDETTPPFGHPSKEGNTTPPFGHPSKEGNTTPPFGHPSKEGNNEAAVKAAIVAFAKAEGYDFSLSDLEAYAHTAKPLSNEALDAAAGGAYDPGTCLCVVGGGGKDPVTGHTCACVLGGGGKPDENGHFLFCIVGGFVCDDDPHCSCPSLGAG